MAAQRSLIHQAIAFVYFCAFSSLYVQWPGLYGWNGLLPADAYVSRIVDLYAPATGGLAGLLSLLLRFPSLGVLSGPAGVSCEGMFEFLMLLGASLSILTCVGVLRGFIAFSTMWVAYLSLFLAGHTFLSFQWDILLLEVGLLSAVAHTPLFLSKSGPRLVQLLFRFIFWKLMFMAGVVKLQSLCPTWLHLTALEYHFATQPLPSPLAWYAHQLHPLLLRLGVAGTLVIEIPCTFLSLARSTTVRRFSVVLQALLQISIIFTGNYTFFNLLTLFLMIPVWERDIIGTSGINDPSLKQSPHSHHSLIRYLALPLLVCLTATISAYGVKIEVDPSFQWPNMHLGTLDASRFDEGVKIDVSETMHALMKQYLPFSGLVAAGATLLMGLIAVIRGMIVVESSPQNSKETRSNATRRKSRFVRIFHRVVSVAHGSVLLPAFIVYLYLLQAPLTQIESKTSDNLLPAFAQDWTAALKTATSPYAVSSGYGLFRVMTGVGAAPPPGGSPGGVGGMPPSVVARPEILLQGYDRDSHEWKDIPFKYKPGDVHRRPPIVAPHQPRLDWQMWFAALGQYQHQPWLIALIDRLLHHGNIAADAISLLDEANYPFRYGSAPLAIRAQLFHYDFTRLNTSWARRQLSIAGDSTASAGILSSSDPNAWWSRKYVADYLPALELNNPSVANFLGHYGIQTRGFKSIDDKMKDCFDSNFSHTEQSLSPAVKMLRNSFKNIVCSSFTIRKVLR